MFVLRRITLDSHGQSQFSGYNILVQTHKGGYI